MLEGRLSPIYLPIYLILLSTFLLPQLVLALILHRIRLGSKNKLLGNQGLRKCLYNCIFLYILCSKLIQKFKDRFQTLYTRRVDHFYIPTRIADDARRGADFQRPPVF